MVSLDTASPKRFKPEGSLLLLGTLALLFLADRLVLDSLSPYIRLLIITASINALLAASLNLVNGVTGLFSIGHAGFMACGAFLAAGLLSQFGSHPAFQTVWTAAGGTGSAMVFALFLLGGGSLAVLAGLAVGIPTLRLRGDYLAIATLGFGEIIRVAVINTEVLGGARGLSVPIRYLMDDRLFPVLSVTLLSIILLYRLVHSNRGLAYLSVREDEIAASSLGISTSRARIEAFVIGSFFAGVGGVLMTFTQTLVHPDSFQFLRSIEIIVMVVLGGMGSFTGSVLAAVTLTLMLEGLRSTPLRAPEWRLIIYSVLLILMMLFRPQGLLGRWEFTGFQRTKRSAEDCA